MADVMTGFTKLFSSIIHSTVWREPNHVRLVWITMLAMKDQRGEVLASVPGLADAARVSIKECADALERLKSPDEWSRSEEHQGRRIESIDGGWFILNHQKYRDLMSADERRIRDAERKRRARDRTRADASGHVRDVSHTEAEADPDTNQNNGSGSSDSPPAPERAIFAYWASKLNHPRARFDAARRTRIRARLIDFTVDELKRAIDGVALSDWHMGRDPKTAGKSYDDFKTIFRCAAQVEKFIEIAEGKQSGSSGTGHRSQQLNHGLTGLESLEENS